MTFERGDLLLIPFPFTDLTSAKRRPVLALTTPDARGDFIGLPVTSRPQSDPALPLVADSLVSGRLPAPSWVRVTHPVTLHASLIVAVLARVRDEDLDEAIRRLVESLRPPPVP